MTMSTFSFVISPPLFRWNMRHIGDTQRLVAFHRSVDDVDGVSAKHRINRCGGPAGPALNLVLPHQMDELPLIRCRQLRKIPAENLAASVVDGLDGAAVQL